MKRISGLLAMIVAVCLLAGCAMDNTDSVYYEKFAVGNAVMPEFADLGDYSEVKTLYHHDYAMFFNWTSYTLIATYDEQHYAKAKQKAQEDYTYRQEPLTDKTGAVTEPRFSLDGYDFCVLGPEYYTAERVFPEQIYLIGTNDAERRIAYIYFLDDDLDTVTSLPEVLQQYCAWGNTNKAK